MVDLRRGKPNETGGFKEATMDSMETIRIDQSSRMKELIEEWRWQIKNLCRSLWWVYAGAIGVFAVIAILRLYYDIPVGYLTRDPGDVIRHNPIEKFDFFRDGIVDLPFYLGAVSYMGILLWCSAAVICFFTFVFLRRSDATDRAFFLVGGLISILLLVDDLFRFHEIVFPAYLHLSEYFPFAIYIFLVLLLLFKYRAYILKTEYLLLLFALGCLALSIFTDVITDTFFRTVSGATLVEDGAKFVGILSWFLYFARVGFQRLEALMQTK